MQAGSDDDFSTQLLNYFHQYKGKAIKRRRRTKNTVLKKTSAVVFDFDGTLTEPGETRTTWETIWEHLGYHPSECGNLAAKFFRNEINHDQWCQMTCDRFMEKNLKRSDVAAIGANIEFIDGIEATLTAIKDAGIPMYCLATTRTKHFGVKMRTWQILWEAKPWQ